MFSVEESGIIGKHSVLIYEDEKEGTKIQFQLIKVALSKNENSIYLTHHKPNTIKKQMKNFGIDLNYYFSKNLLHIIQIPDFMKDSEGPKKSIKKIMDKVLTNLKPPFHIVGRFFPDLTTQDVLNAQVDAEQTCQSNFANFNGSFLCFYQLDKFKKIPREEKQKILQNHHKIIYSSESGNAISFDSHLIR